MSTILSQLILIFRADLDRSPSFLECTLPLPTFLAYVEAKSTGNSAIVLFCYPRITHAVKLFPGSETIHLYLGSEGNEIIQIIRAVEGNEIIPSTEIIRAGRLCIRHRDYA